MPQDSKQWMQHAQIKVGGTNLDTEKMDKLIDITVDTTLNMPSMCVIRLHDDALEIVDSGTFAPGKTLEVQLGSSGASTTSPVFKGEIVAIEAEYTRNLSMNLIIRAYDKLHRLTRGTKYKTFLKMTVSDAVKAIIGEYGLSATIATTSDTYDFLAIDNVSPLEYIQRWADRLGWMIYAEDQTVHIKPLDSRGDAPNLEWGTNLKHFRPRVTLAGQSNQFDVKGWDVKNKAPIVGSASSATLKSQIGILDATPSAKAQSAFSAAKSLIVSEPTPSANSAKKTAEAALTEINMDGVEAEGVAMGDPNLIAGKLVTISSVGAKFGGRYLISSATHHYTPEGYEVEFSIEGRSRKTLSDLVNANPSGHDQRWYGVYPAIVTNIKDDEDNIAQVKVKFPWLDDALESDWARVILPGAGKERGLFILPEINDEVIVAFEHGLFEMPYVIGGVFNNKDKPKPVVSEYTKAGKMQIRELRSREGHRIVINDDTSADSIIITDRTDKYKITIDTKTKALLIESDSDSVKMETSGITMKSTNKITIEGSSGVSIKSTGNVEVNATGQLTLKGSVVNIN